MPVGSKINGIAESPEWWVGSLLWRPRTSFSFFRQQMQFALLDGMEAAHQFIYPATHLLFEQ
jgi:hypothetical protein